ncbi:Reverse transcriptase (RNA-dependent DNA polymerase) [Nesidiocoris tenuis]|uniref:Reverse transcriptase (RNA-dependent DNA polymerase) n=1 Tax=Nesidiocoris tenuis TaxID=355587 RepID=A0ABN7A7R3_9HEMI|nr:Reverse transcriptase (RNA-dependent DNA polymerase) [Nesidiocoris tenuis]
MEGSDLGSDLEENNSRRLSDYRTPRGSQASAFHGSTLARSPPKAGKRPRIDAEEAPQALQAVEKIGNQLEVTFRTLSHELSRFLRKNASKINKECYDFLVEWSSKFSDNGNGMKNHIRHLEGQVTALSDTCQRTITAAIKDAAQHAVSSHQCQSLSPVMSRVDGIREELQQQQKRNNSSGVSQPNQRELLEAMEKIENRSQHIANQMESYSSILRKWSDTPGATDTDEAGWESAGSRRRRRRNRPPAAELQPQNRSTGLEPERPEPQKRSQILGEPFPKLRATVREKLLSSGGPIPTAKSRTLLVSSTEGSTMRKLSSIGRPSDLHMEGIEARPGRNGGVILEADSEETMDRFLQQESVKQAGLEIKEARSKKPRILVHGVPSECTQVEFCEEFAELNLQETPLEERKKGFLPLYKVGPRNQPTVKWVVEVSPEIRWKLIKEGKIRIGWFACRIVDDVSVTRCFQCQGFGHIAAGCQQEKICGYCAGKGHTHKECPKSGPPKCHNCSMARRDDRHEASNTACPSLRYAVEQVIKRTDYGREQ